MRLGGNYHFGTDTLLLLAESVLAEKENSRFQTICESAYSGVYKGQNACAFNMGMAMVETKKFLTKNVSSDMTKWKWRDLHVNDYVYLPWSATPLKPLFHRSVGVGGNDNTVNVSKIKMRKNVDKTVI